MSATWLGGSGNWSDGSFWTTSPDFPNNGTQFYSVEIDNGTTTLDQDIQLQGLSFGPVGIPTLQGNFTLSVSGNLTLNQGLLTGGGTLNALGATAISGDANMYGWRLILAQDTNWTGRLGVGNNSVIDNLVGANLRLSAGAECTYYDPDSTNRQGPSRVLNNYGTITAAAGGTGAILDVNLNNYGAINIASGRLILKDGGLCNGNISIAAGAELQFAATNNGPATENFTFASGSSIKGAGSVWFGAPSEPVQVEGEYDIGNTTTIGGQVEFLAPITTLGTALVINGQFARADLGANSISVNTLHLQAGTLTGSGAITVSGTLEWNEGSITGSGGTIAQGGIFFNGLTNSQGFNTLDRILNCYGSSRVQTTNAYYGNLYFGQNAVLNIMPGGQFNGSHLAILGSSNSGQNYGTITNYGLLVIDALNGMSVFGTNFVNEGALQIVNSSLDVRSTTADAAIIQNSRTTTLQNGSIGESMQINGGSLSGYGMVANIVNNSRLEPTAGNFNFQQSALTLEPNSIVAFTLNGIQPGVSYGQLINISNAIIDGSLQVALSKSFRKRVKASDRFTLISAQTISGQFMNAPSGSRLMITDGTGSFLVSYSGSTVELNSFKPKKRR